jgi:hypothetical protein
MSFPTCSCFDIKFVYSSVYYTIIGIDGTLLAECARITPSVCDLVCLPHMLCEATTDSYVASHIHMMTVDVVVSKPATTMLGYPGLRDVLIRYECFNTDRSGSELVLNLDNMGR